MLRSAVKLEQEQQFLIAKKLQELTGSKNIKLKPVVDPELVAGFVVEYGEPAGQVAAPPPRLAGPTAQAQPALACRRWAADRGCAARQREPLPAHLGPAGAPARSRAD